MLILILILKYFCNSNNSEYFNNSNNINNSNNLNSNNSHESEGIVLLGYSSDSLVFWTDNTIPVENYFINNDGISCNTSISIFLNPIQSWASDI